MFFLTALIAITGRGNINPTVTWRKERDWGHVGGKMAEEFLFDNQIFHELFNSVELDTEKLVREPSPATSIHICSSITQPVA